MRTAIAVFLLAVMTSAAQAQPRGDFSDDNCNENPLIVTAGNVARVANGYKCPKALLDIRYPITVSTDHLWIVAGEVIARQNIKNTGGSIHIHTHQKDITVLCLQLIAADELRMQSHASNIVVKLSNIIRASHIVFWAKRTIRILGGSLIATKDIHFRAWRHIVVHPGKNDPWMEGRNITAQAEIDLDWRRVTATAGNRIFLRALQWQARSHNSSLIGKNITIRGGMKVMTDGSWLDATNRAALDVNVQCKIDKPPCIDAQKSHVQGRVISITTPKALGVINLCGAILKDRRRVNPTVNGDNKAPYERSSVMGDNPGECTSLGLPDAIIE